MITMYHSTARARDLAIIDAPRAGTWVYAVAPTDDEIKQLAKRFKLDDDLLQDSRDPYEAPRVERDGDGVYVYTRYCLPDSDGNATDTMLLIYKPDYLITIMRSEAPVLQRITGGLEPVLTTQKTKLMLQILEEVNSSYRRHINNVTKQLIGIRSQLRQRDVSNETLIMFVDLEDDLNEFLSALQPQAMMLRNLLSGKYLRLYEEDRDLIDDLSLGTVELIELAKSRVKTIVNIRQAYDAIASSELNRIFRRLTSITIFLMIPTIVFSFYGMNVALPLDKHPLAYLFILIIVAVSTGWTIAAFKKRRWL